MTAKEMINILFGSYKNYKEVRKRYIKSDNINSIKDHPQSIEKIAEMGMVLDRLCILFTRRNELYKMMNGEYQDTYNPKWFGEEPIKRKKEAK